MCKNKCLFITFIVVGFGLNSCHFVRTVARNFPDVSDQFFFPSRVIKKANTSFNFREAIDTSLGNKLIVVPTSRTEDSVPQTLNNYIKHSGIIAFMIIRNDSILFERYDKGYDSSDTFSSFSAAKAFVSLLFGIALHDGSIKSLDESITNYIPELKKKKGMSLVTLQDLLDMRSGIKQVKLPFIPFTDPLQFYYGSNAMRYVKRLKIARPVGEKEYSFAASTQLLGIILERATGKPLSNYLQEKIWAKIGTSYDAIWSLDNENGIEKAFCCISARVHDFAKIGRLILAKGNWNGDQIVPKEWFANHNELRSADSLFTVLSKTKNRDYMKNHLFVGTKDYDDYKAAGLYGQYIHAFPNENIVILTFSKRTFKGLLTYDIDVNYSIVNQLINRN